MNRPILSCVLLSFCLASSLIACGADDGKGRTRSAASAEASSKREADAKRALKFARTKDTLASYQDVVERYEGTDAAGEARLEMSRVYASQAREALARSDRIMARQLVKTALEGADPTLANQLRVTVEQIDRADIRFVSQEVKRLLGADAEGCAKAVDLVSRTLGDSPSALLLRDLRAATLQSLSACVSDSIAQSDSAEKLSSAYKRVSAASTKRALGEDTQHSLELMFEEKAGASIAARVKPDLDARKWESAFATLASLADSRGVSARQLEAARQQARDHITSDLLARGERALGSKTAKAMLADIDRALVVLRGMNVSPELKSMQELLAASIECERLKCKPENRVVMVHSLGRNPLLPVASTSAAPVETLPNATRLWLIAKSKDFSLVAREQPSGNSWKARLSAARGWINSSALKRQDTSSWLASGKALEGEQVWLPSGHDDKLYLLGVVLSVNGQSVSVKKVADGATVSVQFDDLRSGHLMSGLRVLAFCNDALKVTDAKVDSLSPNGSSVRVLCPNADGKYERTKDEVLGALRSRLEWLPARQR